MIIATQTTKESLRISLTDHTFLQPFASAKENIRLYRPSAFKRDIEVFIGALAYALSRAIARPKGKDFTLDGSLFYICVDLLDDPEFYGRISYYFEDKGFDSIDIGVRLYNEMITKLNKVIECDVFGNIYIREQPNALIADNEVKDTIKVGNIDVEVSILRNCTMEEDGFCFPKIYLEFLNVDDPKAMCRLVLVDGHDKAKTRPIVFQLSGVPSTRKCFYFELGPASLGAHSHALLGARMSISHRKVDVRGGKTVTTIVTDEGETMLDVYLRPVRKKK